MKEQTCFHRDRRLHSRTHHGALELLADLDVIELDLDLLLGRAGLPRLVGLLLRSVARRGSLGGGDGAEGAARAGGDLGSRPRERLARGSGAAGEERGGREASGSLGERAAQSSQHWCQ